MHRKNQLGIRRLPSLVRRSNTTIATWQQDKTDGYPWLLYRVLVEERTGSALFFAHEDLVTIDAGFVGMLAKQAVELQLDAVGSDTAMDMDIVRALVLS